MSTLASVSSKTDLDLATIVRDGLVGPGQKWLPARCFYDALGSALFDAITLLPEYGLTRADARLLRTFAPEMIERLPGPLLVTELGSGSGQKTRYILEALRTRQPLVRYLPIDVSASALNHCERELIEFAEVHPILDSYIPGIARAAAARTHPNRLLVLFLGSTIGNFGRYEAQLFLQELREHLKPGDSLLLGADLVKPIPNLLEAYDDPVGVTAAFNRNVLARINRELNADFNLRAFAHEARYNAADQRIEMHLRSLTEQTVHIRAAGCRIRFAPGETIWTESSHKYELAELPQMAANSGFRIDAQWTDPEWPFVESLWIAQ